MIPITDFAGRDVAVFGLARTGITAARALVAGGAHVMAWDDSAEARASAEAEGVPVADISARDWRGFAALVLSPGVPLHHPRPHRVVELARAVGVPVIGDVELFARAIAALPAHARPKVVGVTGTNGKSTTTALIGHILKEAGKDARVGGNIGLGVLGLPPLHAGAIYVLELSSFQLDLVESLRCDVAVLLNITPDHLDRHGAMEAYIAAKTRIFRNQGAGDWAVIGVDTEPTAEIVTGLFGAGALRVAAISNIQALGRGVSALGQRIYDALEGRAFIGADLGEARGLPGRHNAQNAAAAYAACRALGLEPRVIASGLASFPGLAHRLEGAGEIDGVRFVNDSKATNADAAAQALAAYPRVYWIAGGRAKDGGIESLEPLFPRVAKAYLIGESAPTFARTLQGAAPYEICGELPRAIRRAHEDALASGEKDAVVLLSPACASFDQYADYEARGEAFKAEVRRFAEEREGEAQTRARA